MRLGRRVPTNPAKYFSLIMPKIILDLIERQKIKRTHKRERKKAKSYVAAINNSIKTQAYSQWKHRI